jgi:L-amino acid N-acyltransferase YncA
MKVRLATIADAEAIARIYNQGIEDRIATFETQSRATGEIEAWFSKEYVVVVAEDGRDVLAFAATFPYRTRECYAGVREFSVYVDRQWRGKGAGRVAMQELIDESRRRGMWKLLLRVFPENTQSLKLLRTLVLERWGYIGSTPDSTVSGATW